MPTLPGFPQLQIDAPGADGAARVRNPVMGYELNAPAQLLAVLSQAAEPQTAETLRLDPTTLAMLIERYLLVSEEDLEVFEPGVQRPVPRPLGRPLALADLEIPEQSAADGRHCRVAFLGAPIDAGGGAGARQGPELIRRGFPMPIHELDCARLLDYEMRREIEVDSLLAWDAGDVPWAPDEGLSTYGRRLRHVVGRLLDAGIQPLIMGGDHSISAHVLPAVFERYNKLHLVHFDAHTDLMATPGRSVQLTHANAMLFALRDPRLASLLQLGVRMLEPVRGERRAEPRLSYFSARELATLDTQQVFASIPAGAPCYLSFDVDVLSPFEAPSTGTPEVGGLGYYQAMNLIDGLARHARIVGADFVEVAGAPGALSGSNTTALLAARLMLQLVFAMGKSTPLTDYAPNPTV